MNLTTFLIAAFIAAAYVAWPNLSKALNVAPGLVMCVVVIVASTMLIAMAYKEVAEIRTIPTKALIWILVIAIANAVAIYLQAFKSADPNIPTGMFLAIIFILEVLFALFADWLVNGTALTKQQLVGLGLAVPAMWLMTAKAA